MANHFVVGGGEFGDGLVEGFLAAGDDGDAGAAIDEHFGQRAAEAGGAAEDQCAFALPIRHGRHQTERIGQDLQDRQDRT